MKEKSLGILLGLLNIILLVVCIVFFLGKDRQSPVIMLEPVNYVYEEDLPIALLYQGVTAVDKEDGDVTSTVVIEKIVADREKGNATITYGACDSSGNVGKITRTLEMPVEVVIQFPAAGEAAINASVSGETENTVEEIQEQNEDSELMLQNESEIAEGQEESGNEMDTEEGVQTIGSTPDLSRPTIVLTTRELTVKVGQNPNWESVMETIQDDKDSRESLLGTLEVHGEYHLEQVGSYYVTLMVTDSDGNESNAYALKLIVEE